MATSDLGTLGEKNGSPVEFTWSMPSLAPAALPWLAILGFLALKPNRRAAAWLILLPLGSVVVFTAFLTSLFPDFLLESISAFAFGFAAVWLLSGFWAGRNRLINFPCILLTLVLFGALAFACAQDWDSLAENGSSFVILMTVPAVANGMALILSGWLCRSCYKPVGLYVWLFVSMTAVWLLAVTPIFIIAEIAEHGRIHLTELFIPVLSVALVNFAILLPFLILSSASPFYRERLKALLHVKPTMPPALNSPAPGGVLRT